MQVLIFKGMKIDIVILLILWVTKQKKKKNKENQKNLKESRLFQLKICGNFSKTY